MSLLISTLSSPREYALGILLLSVACSLLFVLLLLGAYKWATRQRIPVSERVRPPREQPIDLAKERYEFESRRDSYIEELQLRRIA